MRKQYLLFDLDGTLTDPQEGITKSVAYALESYGIHVEDRTQLNKFIGPPLAASFMKYYGMDEEQAAGAVVKYREYFGVRGKFENEVYEGIPQLLQQLKDAGKTLIVATSKPTVYSRQIMEHFELDQYFDDIQGSELNGERAEKSEVIAYALEQNGITEKDQVLMIGDREHDMIGALKCKVDAVGVLYGYGCREEFEKNGAVKIAATVKELGEILAEL